MAVLLPNTSLGVRHKAAPVLDAHGDKPTVSWGSVVGPWPGRKLEGDDVPRGEIGGRSWVLNVDPRLWPVDQDDLIVEPVTGVEWLVTSAKLEKSGADSIVDHVRVEAHLRTAEGTRP